MASAARDRTADLLKGTAVLLMIQVHVMELFATPAVRESFVGRVSLWLGGAPVAPVFLAVMGFYAARPECTGRRLVRRGLGLLLMGGLLNLGLNAHVLYRIATGRLPLSPWEFVFGVDILFAAGLSLLAIAWLRTVLPGRTWLWLSASVLVVAVSPVLTDRLTTDGSGRWVAAYVAGRYTWSYFPLFPWLGYSLLGVAAFHVRDRVPWSTPIAIAGLAGFTAVLLPFGHFAIATSHDLPAYYHHGLAFYLWTCGFLAAWFLLHGLLGHFLEGHGFIDWLAALGRRVTRCYVVQWLLIGNIATAIYQTESLLHCGLWVVSLVAVVSCVAGGRRNDGTQR